jgi:hypothetical protein
MIIFNEKTPHAAHADDAALACQLLTEPESVAQMLDNVADVAARDGKNAAAAAPDLARQINVAVTQCRHAAKLIRNTLTGGRHPNDTDIAMVAAAMGSAGVALETAYGPSFRCCTTSAGA